MAEVLVRRLLMAGIPDDRYTERTTSRIIAGTQERPDAYDRRPSAERSFLRGSNLAGLSYLTIKLTNETSIYHAVARGRHRQ